MQAYEPGCRRSDPVGNGEILGKTTRLNPAHSVRRFEPAGITHHALRLVLTQRLCDNRVWFTSLLTQLWHQPILGQRGEACEPIYFREL